MAGRSLLCSRLLLFVNLETMGYFCVCKLIRNGAEDDKADNER